MALATFACRNLGNLMIALPFWLHSCTTGTVCEHDHVTGPEAAELDPSQLLLIAVQEAFV